REAVRKNLPANVLALMDAIEAFAGLEIGVTGRSGPPRRNDAASATLSFDYATIILPASGSISPLVMLHELLHIERYWMQGVPQLFFADFGVSPVDLMCIDNHLEHFFVVPACRAYGYDDRDYWAREAERNWAEYPWDAEPLERRRYGLTACLGLEL